MRIEEGLFSEALTRYLKDDWPRDLRLVHMDADIYISTRPVLDTLLGPLRYRYLVLFDEFYSVNHEFRAWREFTSLFHVEDWRVVAASEDGAQGADRGELRCRARARRLTTSPRAYRPRLSLCGNPAVKG